MDLSKAFDFLNHELLITKLSAYGFSRPALKLIYTCLHERQQRVKINGSLSALKQTSLGVPQGSVLGPLLFNKFINDFFYLVKGTEVCNYADNTTIFACGSDMCSILKSLEEDASLLSLWFENSYMKMNEDKSHLLVFGSKGEDVSVNISGSLIQVSDEEKLLGLTLDRRLNFKNHVRSLCKKASQKLHALARVSKYMEKSKLELTMTSFVMSHLLSTQLLSTCLDVSCRKSYNKINKIHERALRILHKDSTSSFENLLIKSNSVSIHQRNLQLLLIEIYKTVNNLNPSFMAEVFVTNVVPYNLRGSTNLVLPKARTSLYGIDTVRFVGQKLWQSVPKEIKESQSLDIFKRNIKAIPLDPSCKLCKSYIVNLGFL